MKKAFNKYKTFNILGNCSWKSSSLCHWFYNCFPKKAT